jgi:Silicon transporter
MHADAPKQRENDVHAEPSIFAPLNVVKSIFSMALLTFSIALILGLIFTEQTTVSAKVHPALAFIILLISVVWLANIEGSQGAIVGLAPINNELYRESHPWAYRISLLAHKGDNLDRYLLGRQFSVVLIVFAINNCAHPIAGAELWNLPSIVSSLFLGAGLSLIFFTVMVGQLSAEVNASLCMLDYINDPFSYFTLLASMAIEFSGIIHFSYGIRYMFCYCAGTKVESKEPPRTTFQQIFFWGRVAMSFGCLVYAFIVTLVALFDGKTTMWEGIPPAAGLALFFVLMAIVGLFEATQIAYFAVAKLRQNERGTSIWAKKTCEILYAGKDGQPGVNLPGFMIGRQLFVVSCMFFVAKVTSCNVKPGEETIMGVSEGMQAFFNTGLLGALITTIVGSIAWRLAAATFPIFFMSILPSYIGLKICLALDACGLLNGAWVLGWIHKKVAGFQLDEVYIGTAEERAGKNMADDESSLGTGPGHMIILPGFAAQAPPSLKKLLEQDPAVAAYMRSLHELAAMDTDVSDSEGADHPSRKMEDEEMGV